jgi:hypothetical protein
MTNNDFKNYQIELEELFQIQSQQRKEKSKKLEEDFFKKLDFQDLIISLELVDT